MEGDGHFVRRNTEQAIRYLGRHPTYEYTDDPNDEDIHQCMQKDDNSGLLTALVTKKQ